MDIHYAITVARADAARLARFIERRERFLDALSWSMFTEQFERETTMLDCLLEDDLNDALLYIDWLVERATLHQLDPLTGVTRHQPFPRPWHNEWKTLAA